PNRHKLATATGPEDHLFREERFAELECRHHKPVTPGHMTRTRPAQCQPGPQRTRVPNSAAPISARTLLPKSPSSAKLPSWLTEFGGASSGDPLCPLPQADAHPGTD